ncbi:MAG: archease [Deltaproteobacteria bacterium]|nr:archease [Deltaproteobacteria bacterium]
MRKFEYLDHAGDLGIKIYGKDLPDLFRHAAEALFHVITNPETIQVKETRTLTLQGHNLEELLVDWLNEFIYLFETRGLLFSDFDFFFLNAQTLEAKVGGEPYDESRHVIKTTVKSATYHQLWIQHKKGIWRAQVIIDL